MEPPGTLSYQQRLRQLIQRFKGARPAPAHALKIPNLPHPLSMQVHRANDIHISTAIAERGIWEPDETQFFIDALKAGDTFVDVGANIGYFTLIGSRLVGGQGRVFAFEPDRENYRLLTANCRANNCQNVEHHEAALSNETSTGSLYLSETNMGDHTIYPLEGERSSTQISLLNGSELFQSSKETIDVLKIDTQGSEYQVVQGLGATIADSLPGLIIMVEFSPNSVKKTGYSGAQFLDLFAAYNGYFYLLDGELGGIIPITRLHLEQWSNLTSMDLQSEGFVNLIFSGHELEQVGEFEIVTDLGLFDNALEYLLSNSLPPWDGSPVAADNMPKHLYFSSGWSFFENWGSWSNGQRSIIKFFVGDELRRCQSPVLRLTGRYFGEVEKTVLEINGTPIGAFDLRDASINLPHGALTRGHATLKLVHQLPLRPCDTGDSSDDRALKFGVQSIAIDEG